MADLPSRLTAMPPPKEEDLPPPVPPSPPAPPETGEKKVPPPNLPALWRGPKEKIIKFAKIAAAGILLGLLVGSAAFLGKPVFHYVSDRLTKQFSPTAAEEAIAEGYSMQDVHSERRFQDGSMQLTVEGELHFDGAKATETPDILVIAQGPNGNTIKKWRIDAPKDSLAPGEIVPFQSSVNTPEGTVVDINLSFVPRLLPHAP